MRTGSKQKLKYVIILEILRQETDADHPMQTNTLLKKLEEQGIECSRETLYSDIKALIGLSILFILKKQCTDNRVSCITLLIAIFDHRPAETYFKNISISLTSNGERIKDNFNVLLSIFMSYLTIFGADAFFR